MLYARGQHADSHDPKTLIPQYSVAFRADGAGDKGRAFPGRGFGARHSSAKQTFNIVKLKDYKISDKDKYEIAGVVQDPIPGSQQYFSVAKTGVSCVRFENEAAVKAAKIGDHLGGLGILVSPITWNAADQVYMGDVHLCQTPSAGAAQGANPKRMPTAGLMGADAAAAGAPPAAAMAAAAAAAAAAASTGGAMAPPKTGKSPVSISSSSSEKRDARRGARATLDSGDASALALGKDEVVFKRRRRKHQGGGGSG